MSFKLLYSFHGDDVLKYLSLLSTIDNNSRFCYRINYAQIKAYTMWRHGKFDFDIIDEVLKNGIPQLEDPQEVLFIETVNTPYGSYRVFPTYFLTHKYRLSQLLCIAEHYNVNKKELSIIYALLELSDIIAERCGYARYVVGDTNRDKIYFPKHKEFYTNKNRTTFTQKELAEVLANYNLIIDDINYLLLNIRRNEEIKKEINSKGYSDLFELHPILKLNDGSYIVLFPSTLLRASYLLCYIFLTKKLGETVLLNYVEEYVINEVGSIISNSFAKFIDRNVFANIPFLWFKFDDDKIANIPIVIVDKKYDISIALEKSNKELREKYPNNTIFDLIVFHQIKEDEEMLTLDETIIHFNVEALNIILTRDRMNLLNLYYYALDKKRYSFLPINDDIDIFAYYYSKGLSFYMDNMPDFLFAEIGTALSLREEYFTVSDEHMVYFVLNNKNIRIKHYADTPKQVPIYTPYSNNNNMFMLQLEKNELWIHFDVEEQHLHVFKEIVISILCWMYAIKYNKKIIPICKNTYVELVLVPYGDICWSKVDEHIMMFCIPETIFSKDESSIELKIIQKFVSALKGCEFSNIELSNIIKHMFNENSGRFLQISNNIQADQIYINDGITACYFVNKRSCDIILSEIADYLNLKGEERVFNNKESKEIIIKVLDYLKNETIKILQSIDSNNMLYALLRLHHAMIYWSRLTQVRYDSLYKAYAYIGATFDKQIEYANDYSEMNSLTQGLIETIIFEDIHNVGGNFNCETIDRLFALEHFCLNMGAYLDLLSMKMKNSELVILPNGRLVMPKDLIDNQNSYFQKLRNLSMKFRDLYESFFAFSEHTLLDINNKEFSEAFKCEYGISFDTYHKIITASVDYANIHKKPIVVISKNNFYNKIAKGILSNDDIHLFERNFVLYGSLKEEYPDFSNSWLQRYNRPIQITARPWVLYGDKIYYTTKTLYESLIIKVERLGNASINSVSQEMKKYVGNINKNKGHKFTMSLRKYYEEYGNDLIYVDSEVVISQGKRLDSQKNLGDIDLLLIHKEKKRIVCIEAKNYVESRTIYELMQQKQKIIKDLPLVLERDSWCKNNVHMFKYYDSNVDDDYSVKTIFLTCYENAYNYFDNEKYDICFLSTIDIIKNPMIVFEI